MKEGIKDNLVDLRTIVKYKNGETKTLHEITSQCLLKTSEDTKNQGFEVLSLARCLCLSTRFVIGSQCSFQLVSLVDMIPTELNVNMRPAIFVQAGDVVGHDLHVNVINIYSSCFW